MAAAPDASLLAAGLVCLLVVAATAAGFPLRPSPLAGVGEGTAEVRIVSPTADQLRVTDGRFGTAATYLRVPDLVVEVTALEGRPRLVYRVAVPSLGVDRQVQEVLTGTGRVRLQLGDGAYPPRRLVESVALPSNGTYEGFLVVRVQSFSGDWTVTNRSIRVTLDR